MRTYPMDHGWTIHLPEDWQATYDREAGAFVFFPKGSAMTLYCTVYHGEKQGRPVPAEIMEAAYLQSIPAGAVPFDAEALSPEGFDVKGFSITEEREGKSTLVRLLGFYGPGELLSVGVYGRSEEDCRQALALLRGLGRQSGDL